MFRNMTLGKKLMITFLAVGVIPFAAIGLISVFSASGALSEMAFNQLTAVREIKKIQIQNFFAERQGDMGVLKETVDTLRQDAFQSLKAIQAQKLSAINKFVATRKEDVQLLAAGANTSNAYDRLKRYYSEAGTQASGKMNITAQNYQNLHRDLSDYFSRFNKSYGYHDLFIIDNQTGQVLYTVARESDLGENLATGELKDSGLAKLWRDVAATGETRIVDYAPYQPSKGEPACFIGSPLVRGGKTVAVVALQISHQPVNEIMLLREGMGETGESYLVGQDGLMRSDSYLDPENYSIVTSFRDKKVVDTEAVRSGIGGNDGVKVIADYKGNPVLSCWNAIDLGSDIRWVMISEIDVAEAFCPKDGEGKYFLEKYTELYGYYDLFLINPDGYCFYSVAKEADYQTNLVTGKYSDTNLGQLFKKAIDTQEYTLVDFAPYAPSNDEPAAFIAQPVVYNGEVELVVALQLSLDAINGIMQQREGMGKSGETYLVGEDLLMRSDSFLAPDTHSVRASFADPQKGKVDTLASKGALEGITDTKTIKDYTGGTVLSAYTPVKVGDLSWALIAEIDASEAFAASNAITFTLIVIGLLGVAAIVVVALFVTRSISKPIMVAISGVSMGAEQVASASTQVAEGTQQMAEGASQQAASLEEISSSLEQMTAMATRNTSHTKEADVLARQASGEASKGNEAMVRMNDAISRIKTSSDETAKIIKTIDEIAFQTNLLALNAAVEAARAGDAGKGFAIVAEEVRNLAHRSAEAAKNTTELIVESQNTAKDGVIVSSEVGNILNNILASVDQVTQLVSEVSVAGEEQTQGISQINISISEMDKVTQVNAASTEESASACEELNSQASELKSIVSELKNLIGGKNEDTRLALSAGQNATSATGRRRMLHQPPNLLKGNPGEGRELNPERIIPLDDDDLKEF